jgi:hypothetical protein
MGIPEEDFYAIWKARVGDRPVGHSHFWERALSRRQLLARGAYFPTSPNPVGSPDTIESGRGDPSTITDFNGFIGVGEWAGGKGVDRQGQTLYWAADLRFLDGEYVGLDGLRHQGAFAFV